MQRNQKYVSLIYLACGFVSWLLFREITAMVWAVAHLKQPAGWVLPPSEIIAIGFGVLTFVVLLRNKVVNVFTNETLTELGKVVWPDKKVTVISTGVVSVMVGIAAGILFGFDVLWGAMVRIFYQ
jgi:preprotein translocase SecE subunit